MIKKRHRLTRAAFPSISGGKALFSIYFSVKYAKKSQATSRFSVVVSKKVAKTAVLRNKIRRRVYSILEKSIKPNVSAIFYMKKEVVTAQYGQLKVEVMSCLSKML